LESWCMMTSNPISRITPVLLALVLFAALTACSSGGSASSVDPASVDVTVTTDPAPAKGNEAVKLAGQFTGIELDKSATVSFEIRVGDETEIVDAEFAGDNTFKTDYTFTRTGINEVFVHLYTGDLHVTKKKPVEVQ
jgi:hypothetical protein